MCEFVKEKKNQTDANLDIPSVHSVKLFGFYIDQLFKWNIYVDQLCCC